MSTWSRGVCPSPSMYSSEQIWLLMPKAIVETESLQVSESALKTVVFKISGVGCVGRFQQVDSVALLVGYPCRILKTPSNCDRNNLAGRLHESSLSETVLSSGRCFSPQLSLILIPTPNLVLVSKYFLCHSYWRSFLFWLQEYFQVGWNHETEEGDQRRPDLGNPFTLQFWRLQTIDILHPQMKWIWDTILDSQWTPNPRLCIHKPRDKFPG